MYNTKNLMLMIATALTCATCICSADEIQCTDDKGLIQRIDEQVVEQLSSEKRANVVHKVKTKMNRRGQKAKLIARIKKAEAKLIEQIKATDRELIQEIKQGTIADTANEKVEQVISEKNRKGFLESLKGTLSPEEEEKVRKDITNSEFSESQKEALLEIIDFLHCEVNKIPE